MLAIPFPRARRYGQLSLLVAAALASPAWGLPTGAEVAAGAVTLNRPNAQTLNISQGTSKAIINWQQFNVQANEKVQFLQPSSSAVALNRVVGNNPSAILGQLSANGRIFLVNPNGVLFGAGSKVDVGGLVASTLNLSNQDFLDGRYNFTSGGVSSAVVNQGQITAQEQGYVALLGSQVANEGIVRARLGTVAMAAGDRITLDMVGDKLINLAVDRAAFDASVTNKQLIQAQGGTVIMSAKAANALVRSVVNNEGIIEAHSLVERGGVIRLEASDPVVNTGQRGSQHHLHAVQNAAGGVSNSGTLDVSAIESGAAAGSITLSGQRVLVDGRLSAQGYDLARGGNVLVTSTEKTGVTANGIIDTSGGARSSAGNAVIWSDKDTIFSGSMLATGGANGGNGGALEVSGHDKLNYNGTVDARAASGETGSLLLDPHNITIATAGAGALSAADQFADTSASDVTIAPATLNAAGANIILQANNDITFTNAVSVAGAGIGLSAQAGRSIIVNANITTNNAPISLTANETVANGVVNGNRDAGSAVITMAAAAALASGGGDISIALNNGAGLTNFASGDITLAGVNAGAGNVLIANNGPTAGSGIVRASAAQLITAASAALDVNGAGGGGEIGSAAGPIRLTVSNVEARGQSLGVYLTSPTQAVNVGSSALGGLTGITTSANGPISVTTTASSIATSEAISANGSGTVTLTAAGAASSVTLNSAITSGTGAIALTAANGITLSGAGADVTTTGGYTVSADSDANGTGIYTQNNAGSAVSSGAVTITAADIDLQGTIHAGATAVALRPAQAAATIGVEDASKSFNLSDAELDNITTTSTLTVGQNTNTGGITIGTDGAVSQNKALSFITNTGTITSNGALSTTGNKNVAMTTTNAPIVVNGAIDVAGSGTVTLTAGGAVNGAITLANSITSGTGAIALTAANGITLAGGSADVTTSGAYTVSADSDANGTGIYTQNNAGSAVSSGAVTITAADIDLQGTINAGATAVALRPAQAAATIGVEDASKSFKLSDAELDNITTSSTLTVGVNTNTGGITIGTDGAVSQNKALSFVTNTGTITSNGALSTTGNKNVAMTTTNAPIIVNGAIDVAGSGTVALTAGGAVNGAITLTNSITSGTGTMTFTAANGIALSGADSGVATAGSYTASADSDANGTGIYTQNNAGAAVFSGAAAIIAADVNLQGTINTGAAAIALRPSQTAATIGVEDASKNFTVSNADLDTITTTGTLTIGQSSNSGGITIATDATVDHHTGLLFNSGGNIVVGANGLTNSAAVTLSTTGTGAITVNGPVSTTGSKNISINTTNAPIAINGPINAAGSGTVTIIAAGGVSGSIDLNGPITSGSGAVGLTAPNGITLSGAADIATTGSYAVNADSDSNGTGGYSQATSSVISSGAASITANDINLQGTLNTGSAAVTLRPGLVTTGIGVEDASQPFNLTDAELDNVITTGLVTIGFTATGAPVATSLMIGTDGGLTQNKPLLFTSRGPLQLNGAIDNGNSSVEFNSVQSVTLTGTASVTTSGAYTARADNTIGGSGNLSYLYTQQAGSSVSSGAVLIRAADIDLQGTIDAGSQNVVLQPYWAATTIGVEDASKMFKLSNAELGNVSTTGTLTIGYVINGGISIGTDGPVVVNKNLDFPTSNNIQVNGPISLGSSALTMNAYNGITFSPSGSVTTTGSYSANADYDGNGIGVYSQQAGAAVLSGAATITAADIDLYGTINAGNAAVVLRPSLTTAAIGVNDASKAFNLTDADLDNITTTGSLTIGRNTNTGGITIGTDGAVTQDKSLVFLTNTGAITTNGSLSTVGDNDVTITTVNAAINVNAPIDAAGSGAVTLTAGGAVSGVITLASEISSSSGAVTLNAANGITLSGANADVTTTGFYAVNADSDSTGSGIYAQNHSGSAVSAGGIAVVGQDVDLRGTLDAGAHDITLRPSIPAAIVGVGDTGQDFNVSNAEIARITTTGNLVIGGNAGGMVVATNESIDAGSKNIELMTAGPLTINSAHGIATTGNLTLSADALLLNGGAISGANVTLRPYSTATTVGVEDSSQMLNITNTQLNTVSTPGILTIGRTSNAGGINIAVDGPVALGNKNVSFITGGSIVLGLNDLTTSGNVALAAGGVGSALTLDWGFDEGNGVSVLDRSGNGNHGRLEKAPLRLAGGVLQFDGTNYVMGNPISNMPASEVTVEFLMKATDTVNSGVPVSYTINAAKDEEIRIDNYPNLMMHINNNNTGASGASANDGAWHHIAMSWRAADGQAKIYKDGVQVYSGTLSAGGSITPGGSLVLGQDQDVIGGGFESFQAFKGELDFVRLWNRSLTADNVQQLAANPSSYTNLFNSGTITGRGGAISAGNVTLNGASVGPAGRVTLSSLPGQYSSAPAGSSPTSQGGSSTIPQGGGSPSGSNVTPPTVVVTPAPVLTVSPSPVNAGSFVRAFEGETEDRGQRFTKGSEENNCAAAEAAGLGTSCPPALTENDFSAVNTF